MWRVFVLALGHWPQSVFLFKIPILQSFSEQNFQKLPHFANYFCSKVILLNLLHNSCSGLNKEQKSPWDGFFSTRHDVSKAGFGK